MAKYLVSTRVACIIDADCEDSARDYWDGIANEVTNTYDGIVFDTENETAARELFD